MCAHPVVNDKKPHSHVLERVNRLTAGVKRVELAHEVIENIGAMPDRLGQVTAKRLKGVIDIEKCRPQQFELLRLIHTSAFLGLEKRQV
jgi:hypothetical protein